MGGKEAATPPRLAGCSVAPVRENLTGFPDAGERARAPKLLSAYGTLLRGGHLLAADLGAGRGSPWQRYPNT